MHGNAAEPDASVEAPAVFVGYGVRTPDGRYDDYDTHDSNCRAAHVQIESLADRIRNEVITRRAVVVSYGLVGAWTRKLIAEERETNFGVEDCGDF